MGRQAKSSSLAKTLEICFHKCLRHTTWWQLSLVCIVSILGVGCVPVVQYQPNEGQVDTLGIEQAGQLLRETLLRSINPRIMEVDVTNDFLHYRYQQPIIGPYGATVGFMPGLVENRVAFLNVGRVEVFSNNFVFIRTSGDVLIAQVLFGNEQDAKTFADLMLSFRTHRLRSAR